MEIKKIKLSIVTPYGAIFDGYARSVYLPGVEGDFGVLPGHCDLLSLLKAGVIEIHNMNDKNELIAINWGYVKVNASSVDILANGAVAIAGDNDGEVSKAIENAKALLEDATSDKTSLSNILYRMENDAKNML